MSSDEKMLRLEVSLGERSYRIHIGRNMEAMILGKKNEFLEKGSKVAVVMDQGLLSANPKFLSEFIDSTPHLVLPSGEKTKCSSNLVKIWDFLAQQKVDRTGAVFAIGGGVVGDLAGFAAASFLRGVDLYQVPTTLLSMVDSSVGGKTGINLPAGKNLVGAFHQPSGVYMDLEVLNSLPPREFSAGMSEVIKYGMIGNRGLYGAISGRESPYHSKSPDLQDLIKACCAEKARVVQNDERETAIGGGGRALLNLGHTFAHAIEATAGYGDYLHGESVSIGLVCAFRLSQALEMCESDSEELLSKTLSSYNLPLKLKKSLSILELMNSMGSDKKVLGGKIRFIVMREVGDSLVSDGVDMSLVKEVWRSVGAK